MERRTRAADDETGHPARTPAGTAAFLIVRHKQPVRLTFPKNVFTSLRTNVSIMCMSHFV
jgi:hypothetical protein